MLGVCEARSLLTNLSRRDVIDENGYSEIKNEEAHAFCVLLAAGNFGVGDSFMAVRFRGGSGRNNNGRDPFGFLCHC